MKVEDFFKAVDGARGLCEHIQSKEVEVRLISNDGLIVSDHFELKKASYMFSPIAGRQSGSMVLEIRVK